MPANADIDRQMTNCFSEYLSLNGHMDTPRCLTEADATINVLAEDDNGGLLIVAGNRFFDSLNTLISLSYYGP